MNEEFKETDIVVWQGVITKYGVIKELAEPDDIRLADLDEKITYLNATI